MATIARVAFYVSPHQDDWQLFMNPSAFRDVRDETCRCVFIHVTAGDAGLGTGPGGRSHPLYLARDNGAETAIRFMADADNRLPTEPVATTPFVSGRPVRRVAYRNTVAYFLHLPDGNPEGTGYSATGFQSLQRLAAGEITAITAIDGSATYRGWNDLRTAVRELIFNESGSLPCDIHVPEQDAAINPGDHADHRCSASLVREAAAGIAARWWHHLGYAAGSRPENLDRAERDLKCAVYAVTVAGVLALGHPMSWHHYDALYVGRDHCRREEPAPLPDSRLLPARWPQ